ncbi:MAG: endonuclease/exonuclease/phosphatase family protein [Anaerolineae bacterium]|nr:endonuclease/exonuclease/phosphatase family protein [Anaerolineae bacterium]MDW8098964.1 endonuclease/exonuclease/phosphatase family protein [Anaerolineae bacterium]
MQVRVLTYNIHHWEGTDEKVDVARVAEVIRATAADIVALNEVYHPAPWLERNRPALSVMAEMLGMGWVFGKATEYPWQGQAGLVGYGNACLSRWPIRAYAVHRLPPIPDREPRSLLEVCVELPDGQPLTVYVTHLDHQSEAVRLVQLQAALQWTLRDRGRPHLLLGDLNALSPADFPEPEQWQGMLAFAAAEGFTLEEPKAIPRVLRAGYLDCFAQAGKGEAPTWPTASARMRIDYIFASPALASKLCYCQRWDISPAEIASDHFPVLAMFEL